MLLKSRKICNSISFPSLNYAERSLPGIFVDKSAEYK